MGDVLEEAVVSSTVDAEAKKEWTVLVTGYGPFLDKYPINSSWSIASTLPTHLPATPTTPAITIIKHPSPIKVSYATVTALVPKILTHPSNPDIILHIGLAAGRTFYTLERQSPRGPYDVKKDVDGEVFTADENEALFSTCPPILKPTFNTDDVWRRWRSHLLPLGETADARPSDDPGNFLCGFIYYASMAWFWKRRGGRCGGERPVMFLHVPDCPRESDVQIGREVAVGLIRALVESKIAKGVVETLGEDAVGMEMGIEDGVVLDEGGFKVAVA